MVLHSTWYALGMHLDRPVEVNTKTMKTLTLKLVLRLLYVLQILFRIYVP